MDLMLHVFEMANYRDVIQNRRLPIAVLKPDIVGWESCIVNVTDAWISKPIPNLYFNTLVKL